MFSAWSRNIPISVLTLAFLLPGLSAQDLRVIPATIIIPDGTPIDLRLAESVSSTQAHVGDVLNFIVVKDVEVGGFTVIQAGTVAHGSITTVKGRRILGIGGRISLKLYTVVSVTGDQVGLRARAEVKGGSRTKLMIGAMILTSLVFVPAAPVFLLTPGRKSTILKSTEIIAQTDGETLVLTADLRHSPDGSSALNRMMDYLPSRVFDREGRQGDMVNIVFVGQPEELQETFQRAGWVKTDKWTPTFVWHLLLHGTGDTKLPMARFYLFGRTQDYSYALPDPKGVVSRRHHLRIWRTDFTIDGAPIWAGAATHDIAIEIAKRGRLINHRIDPEVDAERDFIGANLAQTSSINGTEYLQSSDPVFLAQTASGETYYSDSRILLLNLQPVSSANKSTSTRTSAMLRAVSLPAPAPTKSSTNDFRSPR